MKRSIAFSLIIAVIFAIVGSVQHTRITEARTVREKLLAEAAELGISSAWKETDASRSSRGGRPDRDAVAKATARDLIAFAREMEAYQKNPPAEEESEKIQKRVLDFIENLASLDAAQIKVLIAEIRADPALGDDMRKGLISFSVMTLSNSNPRAAITIFTEASDLVADGQMDSGILKGALGKWAKDDPDGALAWVRANSEKFPDLVTEDTKRGLIGGAAVRDPKIALGLISELGLAGNDDSLGDALDSIVRAAVTSEQRSATLEAIRGYAKDSLKSANLQATAINRSLSELGMLICQEGFTSASSWVADNDLSEKELNAFVGGLTSTHKKDTGKWVEWIGEKLPPKQAGEHIENIVHQWTREDYQSAGQWLNTAAEGPAKTAAVLTYARTVAPYEPQTAELWALTLPAGKDRESTLKAIHQTWPKTDAAGKTAFAEKHGIK